MKRKISIFKKQIDLQMDQLKIGRISEFSQFKKLLKLWPASTRSENIRNGEAFAFKTALKPLNFPRAILYLFPNQ